MAAWDWQLFQSLMSQILLIFEVGWLSLAHNLLKQATNDQKRRAAILQ
ncbi:hypothetical protein [Paenibacillus albidus]|nr:hypothetical protein [Paenibacillus albidus]